MMTKSLRTSSFKIESLKDGTQENFTAFALNHLRRKIRFQVFVSESLANIASNLFLLSV